MQAIFPKVVKKFAKRPQNDIYLYKNLLKPPKMSPPNILKHLSNPKKADKRKKEQKRKLKKKISSLRL